MLWSNERTRVIVTTDGEIDDRSSFVRFLLYCNEWDIAGLVYVNSKWHPHGEGTTWMHERIDAYEQVRPNLLRHAQGWPTAAYLRSVCAVGNHEDQGMDGVGDNKDTAGSALIARVLCDSDPRPVWVLGWGGLNTIAQALHSINQHTPALRNRAERKLCLYVIANQEANACEGWIRSHYPNALFLQNNYMFWRSISYSHDRKNPLQGHEVYTEKWVHENVKTGHGPLGELYPAAYQSEGDSPSFFHLITTGLRSTAHPSFGGWGGRFMQDGVNYWCDAADDNDLAKAIWRFILPLSYDFAARMDWCVCEPSAATYPPVVSTDAPEIMSVHPKEQISINAAGSHDPKGLPLAFRWWVYREPGSCSEPLELQGGETAQVSFRLPDIDQPASIHLICEVTTTGALPLTRYKRHIMTITSF